MKLLSVVLCALVLTGCITVTPVSVKNGPSEKLDLGSVRIAKKIALKGFMEEETEIFDQYSAVEVVDIETGDYDFLIEWTEIEEAGWASDSISETTILFSIFTLGVFPAWASYNVISAFSVKDKDGNLVVQYVPGNTGITFKDHTSYSFTYSYSYHIVASTIPIIPMITGKPRDRARKDTAYKLSGALLADMQKHGLL